MFIRWINLIFIILLFTALPVSNFSRADMDKGFEAYDRGDYETALKEMLIDAIKGDAIAQALIGGMYGLGQGVPQNYAEAFRWLHLAADQGLALAQNSLGVMYNKGEGVPQNYVKAYRWFSLAAEQGLADAQFELGGMYFKGNGVPENIITGYMWFSLAGIQGDYQASSNRNYLKARMTPEQIAEAERLTQQWLEEHK